MSQQRSHVAGETRRQPRSLESFSGPAFVFRCGARGEGEHAPLPLREIPWPCTARLARLGRTDCGKTVAGGIAPRIGLGGAQSFLP